MKSLTLMLKYVRDTLTAISTNVYHYSRPANLDGAIVWAEDAEDGSFKVGNHMAEQQIHGTIDYWHKDEYPQTLDDIQAALDSRTRIGWRLSLVDYEDETGLIHHEWEFWVS